MIVVNATVKTSRQDITALQEAIATMEAASRAEAGCRDYTFSVELNNPDVLRITEKWDNVEALQAHFATPHMAAFQAALNTMPSPSMDLKFYDVVEIQPFQ
ncbi:MAG: putative quinol monooxygenase [Halioglobus sp.]